MIPFNKPYCSGRELKYMEEVCHSTTMSGNGDFTKKCHTFFEEKYGFKKCLLTTSGLKCAQCFVISSQVMR